jgi:type II secretory pathway component PulF
MLGPMSTSSRSFTPAPRPQPLGEARPVGRPLDAELAGDIAEALALVHEAAGDEVGATAALAAATSGRARRELARLAAAVARNEPLANAMAAAPSLFRPGDVAAVAAVERSSKMAACVLRAIGRRFAERVRIRRLLVRAAIYPAFLLASYALLSPAMLLVTDSPTAFALGAAQSLALWLAVALGVMVAWRVAAAVPPLRALAHAVVWKLPWLAAPVVHHRRAVYAAALSRALAVGMAPPIALRSAALVAGDLALYDRVAESLGRKEVPERAPAGAAVVDAIDRTAFSRSLARLGIIHPADALLATAAEVAGTLSSALAVLADRNAERRQRAVRLWSRLLGGALTLGLLAQAAIGVVDAYQSFSLTAQGALPDLGGLELAPADLPMPELP